MPFKSEKQRKYLWVHEPKIARRWAHEGKMAHSKTRRHSKGTTRKHTGWHRSKSGRWTKVTVYSRKPRKRHAKKTHKRRRR